MASDQLMGAGMAKSLGIAGTVAVVGLFGWYSSSGGISDEVNFLTSILVPETRAMIKNEGDTTNATSATIASQKRIPNDRRTGATITSPFGVITVAPDSTKTYFDASYPAGAFDTKQCSDFVTQMGQAATIINVGSSTVKSATGSVDSSTLGTACATANAVVKFSFPK